MSTEHEVEILLENLYHTHEKREVAGDEHSARSFIGMSKAFGPNMGIRIFGELDEHGFHRTGYFPYLTGSGVTTRERVNVQIKGSGSGYCGLVEDGRVGVSLIFTVQNPVRYYKEYSRGYFHGDMTTVTFSGLAASGKVLLPAKSDSHAETKPSSEDFYRKHDALVRAARNGNPEAIESLTIEDMDTYAMITRRLVTEDLYSIVETTFMPDGMECDQYQVLGTILFYTKVQNVITKEFVYQMTISCNGMTFDICINEQDLLGEPDVGRRFKGTLWLQGALNFSGRKI